MDTWVNKSQPPEHEESSHKADDALRAQVIALRDGPEPISNSQIGRAVGYSAAVISQYLAPEGCKYTGRVAELESRIRDWLRQRERERKLAVDLIECEVSNAVCAALDQVRRTNDVGLVYGDAGIGKTCAAHLYLRQNPTAVLITLSRWAADPGAIERFLLREIGDSVKRDTRRGEYICDQLRESGRLVIVDNAHKAHRPALEWLFDFWDRTHCPVALLGNEEVMLKIEDNDQRFSRIGLKLKIEVKRPKPLIRHLIEQIVPDSGDTLSHLCEQVAEQRGRFRAVIKHLSLTQFIHDRTGVDWTKAFLAAHQRQVHHYQLS